MTRITLRAARVNAGLTLKEVAKKLGVTERTVGNWEKGSTSIPAKELIALCTIYAISIDAIVLPWLLGYTRSRERSERRHTT